MRCLVGQQGRRPYWLIQTGIGPEAATAAAGKVLSHQPMALIISAGFAGALTTAAAIGDLVIGTSVCAGVYDRTWKPSTDVASCDRAVRASAEAIAAQLGIAARIGPIVSVSRVVCRAEAKQAIGRLTGAVALDMESAALADVAHAQAVPFAVLRTVSDLADEELPLDFNLFLEPRGWLKGIWSVAAHPSSVLGLNRLRRQSRVAADRLAASYAAFAEKGFGLPQSHESGRTR